MDAPGISIIVPNYNHARFLRQRIDSILNQTFRNFEVILLDDCSTDGSQSVLREYAGHPNVTHLVCNARNTGSPCAQWARGIALARGQLIWLAESDDVAAPQLLEVLESRLAAAPGAVLAYCRSTVIDEYGNVHPEPNENNSLFSRWASDFLISGRIELENDLRHFNTIPNASAVVFRRSTAETIKIPTDFRFCGDWLFWARMLAKGDFAYSAEPLNYFRTHSTTTRAVSGEANRCGRAIEALRVIDEIHRIILKQEGSPKLRCTCFSQEWHLLGTPLPWCVIRSKSLPWQIRRDFFWNVVAWRAWWIFERITRWIPGRRNTFRYLSSFRKRSP